mmetsp:Transcript_13496/g.13565  ORF Transcript_13496/g.13565 Transcript_13496/m.13565 type:complete len:241 (-) Transcript_13496:95-817(-)
MERGKSLMLFGIAVVGGLTLRRLKSQHIYGILCSFSDIRSKSIRKKSSIYTKTGDGGSSMLYNGERRSKSDVVFEALGNQDELNACLGIAREYSELNSIGLETMLIEIQSRLFDVGAAVATPVDNSTEEKLKYTKLSPLFTQQVEEWIDDLDLSLPPLQHFVIPSGGLCSTHLNLSRTVCRRAERSVTPLISSNQVDPEVGRYLNRLSDLLFVAGRIAAVREGKKEILWKKVTLETDNKS